MAKSFTGSYEDIPWQVLETPKGKGSKAYNAHSYHTKLSLGICRTLIRHFTGKDTLVLDPFAGSGMVGVASLLEKRNSVLIDISPYAVHISKGLTTYVDPASFLASGQKVVQKTRDQVEDLLFTRSRQSGKQVEISYVVWSEQLSCPNCGDVFVLWDASVERNGRIAMIFPCPHCSLELDKRHLLRQGSVPVEIVYKESNRRCQCRASPTQEDLTLCLEPREPQTPPPWRPSVPMMNVDSGQWGQQWRRGYHHNVTHVKDFFSPRNWLILGYLWANIQEEEDEEVRRLLSLAFTATLVNTSRMVRYTPSRGGRSNTPGTLYFPMIWLEQNPVLVFERRLRRIRAFLESYGRLYSNEVDVHVGSASQLNQLGNESVDFILTDPPFGGNIQYAELNFIAESWLNSTTKTKLEAVMNQFRGQTRDHYLAIMRKSLLEAFRVLKKGRYAAFFFNNTDSKLWIALRQLMTEAGFKIVRVVPACKGHRGWNQVRHKHTVTAWDPIIFLWKPIHKQRQVLFSHEAKRDKYNAKRLVRGFLRGVIALRPKGSATSLPYQQLYSQYISAWFEGKMPGNILGIRSFISEAKKISNEAQTEYKFTREYSSLEEDSKGFIEALKLVSGRFADHITGIPLCRLYENEIEGISGGSLARRRRTSGTIRRKRGAFYTPPSLAALTINETLDQWLRPKLELIERLLVKKELTSTIQLIEKIVNVAILDPAVGTGLFLLGARQYLREMVPTALRTLINSDIEPTDLIEKSGLLESNATEIGSSWDNWIVEHALWGVDLDVGALHIAKKIVCDGLTKDNRGPHLLQSDSLRFPLYQWQKLSNQQDHHPTTWQDWFKRSTGKASRWDVVIGNPPWGIMIPDDGNLDYSTCHEESALAFLLLAEKILGKNGIVGFVLPSSWLQASSWKSWRTKYVKRLGLKDIFVLSEEVFPDATFTAPPIVAIFAPNSADETFRCRIVSSSKLSQPIRSEGCLLRDWNKQLRQIEQVLLYELTYSHLSKIPNSRIPVAGWWWIKRFYKTPEKQGARLSSDMIPIKNRVKKVVRGVKTGNNKRFISVYDPEFHHPLPYDRNKGLFGFDSPAPAWVWLAKGGVAISDGYPIHFLQPHSHVLRWDEEAVSIYQNRQGLRNKEYYGVVGIGFPSTGRYSPLFRKVEKMVFDADYPVIIPFSEGDIPCLLAILNSPAILFAAKHLLNHSVHFKTNDLLDLPIPNVTGILRDQLSFLSTNIIKSMQTGNKDEEMKNFRRIHEIVCDLLRIPLDEKAACESWYISRFPGMRRAFESTVKSKFTS